MGMMNAWLNNERRVTHDPHTAGAMQSEDTITRSPGSSSFLGSAMSDYERDIKTVLYEINEIGHTGNKPKI